MQIGVAENQRHNLFAWQKTGFTDFAGWWHDPGLLRNMIEFVKALLTDSNIYRNRCQIGPGIIDGKGALRIVEQAIEFGNRTDQI